MAKPVMLYQWPDSQICLDCEYGVGIASDTVGMDDIIGPSAAICIKNYEKEFGKPCPKYMPEI